MKICPYTAVVDRESKCRVLVLVAHPDDETLWCGGVMLTSKNTCFHIVSLCRGSDADRAPKFSRAVERFHAGGDMGDLDDGPEQYPLDEYELKRGILQHVDRYVAIHRQNFDVIISHSPRGEYTRHRRHEEVGRAIIELWGNRRIVATELWLFAYDDDGKRHLPVAIESAHKRLVLPREIWAEKYRIITRIYGFSPDSFEARCAPTIESFWCFHSPDSSIEWLARIHEPESQL